MIKKILKIIIPSGIKNKINNIRCQIKNFGILAKRYNQFQTIKQSKCVDSEGNCLPWYTYPAIEYIMNLDFSTKSIFEFGCGYSSFFWSKAAKKIVSVEHNKIWFEKISSKLNNNQKLFLVKENEDYENSIRLKKTKYDVIIIDAIRRVECSKVIKNFINNDSPDCCMVILDNSDWYPDTSKYLRTELNFIQVDFHGFGPINNYTWTTSLFLSRNFNFKAKDDYQPNYSVAALRINREE